MLNSLRYNLTRLVIFAGRESRVLFWPYAACVFVLGFVAVGVVMNLELVNLVSDPSAATSDFTRLVTALATVVSGMVLLLAAAVSRRLHNRDRTARWGLLPPLFLLLNVLGAVRLFAMALGSEEPDLTRVAPLFFGLFLSNGCYLASLGWLLYLLATSKGEGPNRFGAAT